MAMFPLILQAAPARSLLTAFISVLLWMIVLILAGLAQQTNVLLAMFVQIMQTETIDQALMSRKTASLDSCLMQHPDLQIDCQLFTWVLCWWIYII